MNSIREEAPIGHEVQFDREKFLDVLHYVIHIANPGELGRVKLHKVLYFCDMLSYLDTGRPMTGVEYRKQAFGPVAQHLGWGLSELQRRQLIEAGERNYFGYRKLDVVSLAEPSVSRIPGAERQLIADVVAFVTGHSAKEISELSHNAAWQVAAMGESIPYFSAPGLIPVEVTDEDWTWADREARRLFGTAPEA